jgi:hypothetical protein
MVELKHPLLTSKYTRILNEDPEEIKFGAPHHFKVIAAEPTGTDEQGEPLHAVLVDINFQEGPIKENGVNGCANEDLFHMVLARLNGFQDTPYACRENALAITYLEQALMWLRYRTDKRVQNNTEGTSKI